MITHLLPSLLLYVSSLATFRSGDHLLESFTVKTLNVEVRQLTETSIQLKSDTNAYCIHLEPNKEGKVVFSLSGIGYASTAKLPNLRFGVKILGYRADDIVYPIFSFDDVNRDIKVEQNTLIFQRIYGSIPVWFNEQVDSIQLQFTNSLSANVDQYLGIQDLRIVPESDVCANPFVVPCQQNQVMIAIDGSSSIDNEERNLIAAQLLDFVRKTSFTQDSHQLCIAEFGSDIVSVVESTEKRVLIDALQKYKRGKNNKSKMTSWTNWSIAFAEAINRKPDLLIFITDGWSNWINQQPSTFSAQYEKLISQSNMLKVNGTRLLFITSDIDVQQNSGTILSSFLNGDQTHELQQKMLFQDINLSDVDLITMDDFAAIPALNFSSILDCTEEVHEVVIENVHHTQQAGRTLEWW